MNAADKTATATIGNPLITTPASHGADMWLWSVVLITIALFCMLLPMLIAIGPEDTDWLHLSLPPSPSNGHWLGTDAIGRDVLIRACYGGRLSLLIGLAASLIALVVGTAYGVLAGYCGGFVESAMMISTTDHNHVSQPRDAVAAISGLAMVAVAVLSAAFMRHDHATTGGSDNLLKVGNDLRDRACSGAT